MLTLSLVLLLIALLITIASGLGRAPLWIAVLLLVLAEIFASSGNL